MVSPRALAIFMMQGFIATSVSGFWQKSCGCFSATAMNCALVSPSSPALPSMALRVSGF
jgi:hypothetical protein